MVLLQWHTKDNSVNLLLKIKWFQSKLPGPFYLNVVPWLKKVPADTLSLIILKQLYFFTFKYIYIYIFKRPMLIYKNIIRSHA